MVKVTPIMKFCNIEQWNCAHCTCCVCRKDLPAGTSHTHVSAVKKILDGGKPSTNPKKANYCVFCGVASRALARHFLQVHNNKAEVSAAMRLPLNSLERKRAFKVLASRGNYQHNARVMSGIDTVACCT